MPVAAPEFDYVRRLVRDRSGVVLDDSKTYLVESRLRPVLKRHAMRTLTDLVAALRRHPPDELAAEVVEAMLTGETAFFRDGAPFEALRDHVLPELTRTPRARPLNIWCAAASSGQEPYSVAMLLADHFPHLGNGRARIIATALSNQALSRARAGVFNDVEIARGIANDVRDRYFDREDGQYRIAEHLKRTIEFRQINLLHNVPPFAPFDLVLMRNVLVYFDPELRSAILTRTAATMAPGGYLLLGSSEGVVSDTSLQAVRHGRTRFFRRVSASERTSHPGLEPRHPG